MVYKRLKTRIGTGSSVGMAGGFNRLFGLNSSMGNLSFVWPLWKCASLIDLHDSWGLGECFP